LWQFVYVLVFEMKKLVVLVALGALLVTPCLTTFKFPILNLAYASSTLPFVGTEYSNGTMASEIPPLSIWYDWVNVSGTQVVNYVLYGVAGSSAPTPIANFVMQHLQLADGSQVLVASALDRMEVYRDVNGTGVPDANFTSGDGDILFTMYMNMSDSYGVIPIQKTVEGGVPHYLWGFTYVGVYAYLQNVTVGYGVVAKLILDHLTVSYDFSLDGNVSSLKTSFDIGKVASMVVLDSSQLSLDGLSLALLYPTVTYCSNASSTYVNGEPYNSGTTNDSALAMDVATVAVGSTKAYDFVFGGNYTLVQGGSNETYETKTEASALSSVPTQVYGSAVWQTSFFTDELNLSELFGGSWPDFTMNYEASQLIYRLCFPVWSGAQIQCDPVYVGYLYSSTEVPEMPTVTLLLITIAAATLILTFTKKRKFKINKTEQTFVCA
jgi:hypothetical protein